MRKIYYVYKKASGELAISVTHPARGHIVGMSGTLEGAKQLKADKLNERRRAQRGFYG